MMHLPNWHDFPVQNPDGQHVHKKITANHPGMLRWVHSDRHQAPSRILTDDLPMNN